MDPAIRVSSLTKCFGDFTAVDHIGFEVKEGEIFGFLGPNGAGKTTTQRMLTGILKPDAGSIMVNGYDLLKRPFEAKMLMGVVPEMANTYVDMTAWENLMLMGKLYGVDKKRRHTRAEELLAFFALSDKKDIKTKAFSKGMKQKLILSMAMIHEPRLIFLDEPTSGLDVQSTRLIRQLVNEYHKNGATIFLTTHNIEEADHLCDRIAIINQGKIVAIDRPAVLRSIINTSQSVEVAFNKSTDRLSSIQSWDSVHEVRKEGDKYRLVTDQPGEVINRLVEYAHAENLKLLSLNTHDAKLEDVFLHITKAEGG